MSLSISEDIKSVSELKKKTNEIFRQMHSTGRPVIVTVNGKPDAVLIEVKVFEKKLKSLNLGMSLAEAEADLKEGRVRKARSFLKELKNSAKKISG
jgi:prevent-host-death family protein